MPSISMRCGSWTTSPTVRPAVEVAEPGDDHRSCADLTPNGQSGALYPISRHRSGGTMAHHPTAKPPPQLDQTGAAASLRAQILATEHWSLLATRSMTWNEIFSRTGTFLTVLSASVVALSLVAQATDFGD